MLANPWETQDDNFRRERSENLTFELLVRTVDDAFEGHAEPFIGIGVVDR